MSKRHYDLVFGIGIACSCTQSLRLAKLQHASMPAVAKALRHVAKA